MATFFEKFPKISYDIQGKQRTSYQTVTNIFFRVRILKEVLGNISAYYEYLIRDSDTPEILAENVYGDPEAHWIILLSNDIVDPQYDWPLTSENFRRYIIDKYGSVENAKTTYHHYEKVIAREESASGTVTETRFEIDYAAQTNTILVMTDVTGDYTVGNTVFVSADSNLANATIRAVVLNWSNTTNQLVLRNVVKPANTKIQYQTLQESNSSTTGVVSSYVLPLVPYDTYLSLPETLSYDVVDMGNGKSVAESIRREAVSNYDWEVEQNEQKRAIKIIKPEYYRQIIQEFNRLVETNERNTYIRRLT